MKQVNVGILGATGAVGQEMIKILEERNFPVAELRLIASERSAGTTLPFKGKDIPVIAAADDVFDGLDIVLGAAENDIAERFAPAIVKAGAIFVDNSSAFRLDPEVPLVIPEINPEDAKKNNGIIANPNCTTTVTLMAINALAKESPVETIIASSYANILVLYLYKMQPKGTVMMEKWPILICLDIPAIGKTPTIHAPARMLQ